jgi:hypothetical protein
VLSKSRWPLGRINAPIDFIKMVIILYATVSVLRPADKTITAIEQQMATKNKSIMR